MLRCARDTVLSRLRPACFRDRAFGRVDRQRLAVLPLDDTDGRTSAAASLVELHAAREGVGCAPGLEVELVNLIVDLDPVSHAGALQSFIGEWYSWINDPIYHIHWNFNSAATGTNGVGYSNPRVDEIIAAAMYEPDAAAREALSKEAQQIIVDEAPWAFLFQINYVVAARNNIKGFQWNTDTATRYWMVSKE